MNFLFGLDGATFVTGPDGKVTLVPGTPIVELGPPTQAILPNFVTDSDSVLAPVLSGFLLPAALADSDAVYAAGVTSTASVLPAPVTDADTIYAVPSITADAPGHGRQTLRPDVASDTDVIYTAAVGRGVYPAVFTDGDIIYAASLTRVILPATVPTDDVIPNFRTTLFAHPALVFDSDSVYAADVGWRLFAATVTDADVVYGVHVEAYSDLAPDILVEDDDISTYPFFVHGVTGGIPVPEKPHLSGSLRPPLRVLTGSIKKTIRLTGSTKDTKRRVLTGSFGATYGKAPKR